MKTPSPTTAPAPSRRWLVALGVGLLALAVGSALSVPLFLRAPAGPDAAQPGPDASAGPDASPALDAAAPEPLDAASPVFDASAHLKVAPAGEHKTRLGRDAGSPDTGPPEPKLEIEPSLPPR